MPKYGKPEPTYSEDRYHILFNDEDEFVLFNGDGNVILVYEKSSRGRD